MAPKTTKRSFSSTPAVETDPIKFDFDGQEFEALGEVTGSVLLEFIAASDSGDSAQIAGGIVNYLKASMTPKEYKRFHAITHDASKVVNIETLADIASMLIEERTSRPTEASSE